VNTFNGKPMVFMYPHTDHKEARMRMIPGPTWRAGGGMETGGGNLPPTHGGGCGLAFGAALAAFAADWRPGERWAQRPGRRWGRRLGER